MTDEIDDVLYDWYQWNKAYEPALGYGRADSTCRDFKISRQWMDHSDLSDLVDYQLREAVGKIVEPIVFAMSVRHRMAIQTAMKNMEAGYTVWTNPRYPETQAQDYAYAKTELRPKLVAKGLLTALVNPKELA